MALRYEELKSALDEAPMTWVPALLCALIRRAVKVKTFRADGGLREFVALAEKEAEQ